MAKRASRKSRGRAHKGRSNASGRPDVPPIEVLRGAFRTCANYFEVIRREWLKSDQARLKLIAAGCSPESGSYAEIVREEIRAEVYHAWRKLRDDADMLPMILPHCDPLLRDAVLRLIRLSDLDAHFPDIYGELTERWRQTWPATGLDAEVDELVAKLRTAGEALVIKGDEAQKVAVTVESVLEKHLRRLAKSDPGSPGKGRKRGVAKVQWPDAISKAEAWVRAHQGQFPGRNQLAKEVGYHPSVMTKAIRRSTYLTARAAEVRAERRPRRVRADVARMGRPAASRDDAAELERLIQEQQADAQRDARRPRKPRAA